MPNTKKKWIIGDSTSIRLTDVISPKTFTILNNEEVLNRNQFIAKGMNSQAIIEYGSTEEKLQLIGLSNLSDLLNLSAVIKDEDTDRESVGLEKSDSQVYKIPKSNEEMVLDDWIPSIG